MRAAFVGLLTFGLLGSPLAAQVAPKPKPPEFPPVATLPNQPPKPGVTTTVKKEKTGKRIPITSLSDVSARVEWMALDDEDQIEIKDITVREFFKLVQAIGFFGTIVIKDNLKDEMMPQTILLKRGLGDYIFTLDKFADDFEVKLVEGSAEVLVVSAKPKSSGKPNTLFMPVNLEPLLAGIREPELKGKKVMDIKNAISQGVELETQMRGLKPTVDLKLMMHAETSLLFVAGPTEQVDVAIKIFSALGARIPHQEINRPGFAGRMMGGAAMAIPRMAPEDTIPRGSESAGTFPSLMPLPGLPNPGGVAPGGVETPALPDLPVPGASGPRSTGLPAGR
jgi:hypothetical protein